MACLLRGNAELPWNVTTQQSLTPIYRTEPLKLFRKMFKLATVHFLISKITALPCDLPNVHDVCLFPLSSREQNILIHILSYCKHLCFFCFFFSTVKSKHSGAVGRVLLTNAAQDTMSCMCKTRSSEIRPEGLWSVAGCMPFANDVDFLRSNGPTWGWEGSPGQSICRVMKLQRCVMS